MRSAMTSEEFPAAPEVSRARRLQTLGILSGLTAGAWLGAAEEPDRLRAAWLSASSGSSATA